MFPDGEAALNELLWVLKGFLNFPGVLVFVGLTSGTYWPTFDSLTIFFCIILRVYSPLSRVPQFSKVLSSLYVCHHLTFILLCSLHVINSLNIYLWNARSRSTKQDMKLNCLWMSSIPNPERRTPGKARRGRMRRKEKGSRALWFEVNWSIVSCEQAAGKGGEWWWCMGTVWCCEWAVWHAVSREIPALPPSDGINWWWMKRERGKCRDNVESAGRFPLNVNLILKTNTPQGQLKTMLTLPGGKMNMQIWAIVFGTDLSFKRLTDALMCVFASWLLRACHKRRRWMNRLWPFLKSYLKCCSVLLSAVANTSDNACQSTRATFSCRNQFSKCASESVKKTFNQFC